MHLWPFERGNEESRKEVSQAGRREKEQGVMVSAENLDRNLRPPSVSECPETFVLSRYRRRPCRWSTPAPDVHRMRRESRPLPHRSAPSSTPEATAGGLRSETTAARRCRPPISYRLAMARGRALLTEARERMAGGSARVEG